MTRKRRMFGVLTALSWVAAAALSLPACAQETRRTEPSSRAVAERGQLTAAEQSITARYNIPVGLPSGPEPRPADTEAARMGRRSTAPPSSTTPRRREPLPNSH